jgi:predicted enzyme related to lactoylglutathione lyase
VHARSIDVDIARVEEAGGPVVKPDFDGTEDDDDVA